MKKKNNIVNNTVMLYALSVAKILFPMATLPYLTRVLSAETYGTVAYVKSIMQYMQLIIDFGFILSGTKDIVRAGNDSKKIGEETGDILVARLLLAGVAFAVLLVMIVCLPILKGYEAFTLFMFINIVLSIFLFDYLFRGIEKMQVITKRYVVMKAISTLLTFVFIHDDADMYFIPLLDVVGSLIAVIWVALEMKKLGIRLRFTSLGNAWAKLKESAVYFISNMATTAFGALNTFVIGIFMSAADVAYWSVCMQVIGGVQSMYSPLISGVYPEMMKKPRFKLIKKYLMVFMPLIAVGCVLAYLLAEIGLVILGGEKYAVATPVFRALIPVLAFGFPAMLLGWPTLGAIDKAKHVSMTTVASSIFQISGLLFLAWIGKFELLLVAAWRSMTEVCLFATRAICVWKDRKHFDYKEV